VISQHIQTNYKQTVLILGSNSFVAKNIIAEIPFRKIICVQKRKYNILKRNNLKYYFFNLMQIKNLKRIISKNRLDKVIICSSNNNNCNNLSNDNINIFFQNTNILLNVLESLKFKKKIQIINFTSTEVSKKNSSMYSLAKETNDRLCEFYKSNYSLKINNIILPNLFGKNDLNFNRIIPLLIKKIFFKKKIILKNYSKKLKFMFVESLFEIIISSKKRINSTYLISINQLIKRINYLIRLNNNVEKNNFKSTFDYQLYQTIIWYKNYFKKKNNK
jgi:nucleoside-diphosphate-sugar epimerase